jgi:hypothetical protein
MQVLPTKQKQVVARFKKEKEEQYLVVNDPCSEASNILTLCSISELQRASAQNRAPNLSHYPKEEFTVLADTLEEFIQSWNSKD